MVTDWLAFSHPVQRFLVLKAEGLALGSPRLGISNDQIESFLPRNNFPWAFPVLRLFSSSSVT